MRGSKLTVSQALKLYTGTGLAGTILGLAAFELAFYIGAAVCMTLMIMLGEGIPYPEAVKNISETPAGDCMMAFAPSVINCIVLLSQYRKDKPGGKLFRTVNGGFDTFMRYRAGVYISMLLSLVIYGSAVLLLTLIGVLGLHGGSSAVIAVVVSSVAAVGVVTLLLLIKDERVCALVSVVAALAVTGSCTALLPMLTDSLLPHLYIGILGAALIAVSTKAYFSHYKKHIWN